MSLPPGFLDEIRSRLTLSDVAGRKVSWDRRRSNAARGDWWAPCPFHQEKTASFHVDDRKGFFYCFGCQTKGDLIDFVRETENLDFMGAVEMLAREAGLEMPAAGRDPHAAERRDRIARLADVMEEAVRAYGRAFRSAAGQGARDYARSRGLIEATLKRFEIGFAPAERHFLSGPLREKGLLDDAVAAGLVIVPEDGGAPFDRFRDRLMFPIRDASGRCIAFGGRAMSPEARAKYLNSPETELFHKGRTLYNHGAAREAAGKAGSLIVAEGYMDVIALTQAGFEHAVAPLGTAVTEEQLGLIWRMADEPVIALDGDRAGLAAAERLIDMALPLLAPGRSLGFCLLPDGQDPDDLIRSGGAPAMAAALDNTIPLVEMLWRKEVNKEHLNTPERKAALNSRVKAALQRIKDNAVRKYYTEAVYDRWQHLVPRGRKPGKANSAYVRELRRGSTPAMLGPTAATLSSELASAVTLESIAKSREACALLICLNNIRSVEELDVPLEAMEMSLPEFVTIRDCLISVLINLEEPIAAIAERLQRDPIMLLRKFPRARAHPYARPWEDATQVVAAVEEIVAIHEAELAYQREMTSARREIREAEREDFTARIRTVLLERFQAFRSSLRGLEQEEPEGVFQRMLDDGLWRRRKKP